MKKILTEPARRRDGEMPDYRFSLANERTFLAWIRTSMAILAGAIAIDQLTPQIESPPVRFSLCLGLALIGAFLGRGSIPALVSSGAGYAPQTGAPARLAPDSDGVRHCGRGRGLRPPYPSCSMNAPSTPDGRAASADPGLQPERTALAWRRTLLAMIVAVFFIWRAWLHVLAGQEGQPAGSILGLGIASAGTAAASVAICGCVTYRTLALRPISSAPPALLLRIATAAVLTLAAAVTASIILSHVGV